MNGEMPESWEWIIILMVAWSIVHILQSCLGWLIQLHDDFCRRHNLPYLF